MDCATHNLLDLRVLYRIDPLEREGELMPTNKQCRLGETGSGDAQQDAVYLVSSHD